MSKLRTWRTSQTPPVTQAELAAQIGIEQPTVSRIEAGEQWPSAAVITAIERITDGAVTASDIAAAFEAARQKEGSAA